MGIKPDTSYQAELRKSARLAQQWNDMLLLGRVPVRRPTQVGYEPQGFSRHGLYWAAALSRRAYGGVKLMMWVIWTLKHSTTANARRNFKGLRTGHPRAQRGTT
jgi:hypothetical protein